MRVGPSYSPGHTFWSGYLGILYMKCDSKIKNRDDFNAHIFQASAWMIFAKIFGQRKSHGQSQLIWEEAIHEYGDRDT